MIIAKIILKDKNRTKITRYFDWWADLGAWMDRHHGHLKEVHAFLK